MSSCMWFLSQEYYIRHVDGCPLDAEGERRIRKCLEAAIKRRSSEVELHLAFNRYDGNFIIASVSIILELSVKLLTRFLYSSFL